MKIIHLAKKNIEFILIFGFIAVYLFIKIGSFCRIFSSTDFDSQALFMWDYLAAKGYMPYRDVYYPYGILYFFKNTNFIFSLLHIFLLSGLLVAIFVFLKKLWRNNYFAYITFASFLVFVNLFTGLDTLGRYGIVMVFNLFCAYLFSRNKNISIKSIWLMGILNGVIFSFFYDQGLYSTIFFIFFLFIDPLIKYKREVLKEKSFYNTFIKEAFIFLIGFIIGIFPYVIYLFLSKSLIGFLVNIVTLKDAALYAKTPFFPYSASPENLFVFSVLVIAIIYLGYTLFFKHKSHSLSLYGIFYLVLLLLLLEQKNIIRSISGQLTFISFFLLIILGHEFYRFLSKYRISSLSIGIYFIAFVVVLITSTSLEKNHTYVEKKTNYKMSCVEKNKRLVLSTNKQIRDLKNYINGIRKSSEIIHSYPGDPLIYILFDSPFPYYFSTYEGSPRYAQEKRIDFLRNSKYVLFDLSLLAIQDGVPEYVRSSSELKYILNNFSIIKRIGNFLVFNRNKKEEDFFKGTFLDRVPELRNYLLQVDFAAIPKSEGLHKKSLVKSDNNIIFPKSSIKDINSFLANKFIKSDNAVLVIWTDNVGYKSEKASITLKTNDNSETKISFYQCSNRTPCIINLSRVPLFYKNRIIEKIIVGQNFKDLIEIRNIYDDNELW